MKHSLYECVCVCVLLFKLEAFVFALHYNLQIAKIYYKNKIYARLSSFSLLIIKVVARQFDE